MRRSVRAGDSAVKSTVSRVARDLQSRPEYVRAFQKSALPFSLSPALLPALHLYEDPFCLAPYSNNLMHSLINPVDTTRMDLVIPGEQHIYLRAATSQERQQWLVALGSAKACVTTRSRKDSGESNPDNLKFKKSELRLYCDLLMQQVHMVKTAATQDGGPQLKANRESRTTLAIVELLSTSSTLEAIKCGELGSVESSLPTSIFAMYLLQRLRLLDHITPPSPIPLLTPILIPVIIGRDVLNRVCQGQAKSLMKIFLFEFLVRRNNTPNVNPPTLTMMACASRKLPDCFYLDTKDKKLDEATSLLGATCDTFIRTLEDCMKICNSNLAYEHPLQHTTELALPTIAANQTKAKEILKIGNGKIVK
uniref:PH domain-containing protein n=1 Tax=Timema poppense TaxID=170557 RepID=A0A7R9H7B3_TIMPO|nr:unnamed protein product [Timema poppensis]